VTISDDPRWRRSKALLERDPQTLSGKEGLRLVGRLIDSSSDLDDPAGLRRAIAIAPDVEARLSAPTDKTQLHYFIGNAWFELQGLRATPATGIWDWDQPEAEDAIIEYRTAINSEGFGRLPGHARSRVFTNLGNLLDHLGRFVEAIESYERALQATPSFGMALGNRALSLRTYGVHLYDKGHALLFLKTAHEHLGLALRKRLEGNGRAGFTLHRADIERLLSGNLARRTNLEAHSLGETPEEQAYRRAILKDRLFLNPLNDLGPYPIGARDVLSTPPITVRAGHGPYYQGVMNQLKQEFIAARYLHYQGSTTRTHYADHGTTLTDTLDYPAYGLHNEYLRIAYRLAYSLLDKIAFFLNHYLDLRIPEHKVFFRSIWYNNQDPTKGLRDEFLRRENLPLRGLYWLVKDLASTDPRVKGALEPDAQDLAAIRNQLEHKYLKLHTEGFLKPGRATGPLRDILALSINQHSFQKKCLRLLKLSRAGLIYLTLAIHREEHARENTRPPGQRIPTIKLNRIPDNHN
jgi:tetratricopeptide (TPR) repeat protein